MGLKKGDRVIFICPNSPAILEGHFAVPLAGGVIVTVNTRLKPEEIGYIVQHSGARFAIVDRELGHLKEAMLGEWGVEKVIVDQDTGKVGCEFQDMLDKAEPKTWYDFDMVEDEDELMSICCEESLGLRFFDPFLTSLNHPLHHALAPSWTPTGPPHGPSVPFCYVNC